MPCVFGMNILNIGYFTTAIMLLTCSIRQIPSSRLKITAMITFSAVSRIRLRKKIYVYYAGILWSSFFNQNKSRKKNNN